MPAGDLARKGEHIFKQDSDGTWKHYATWMHGAWYTRISAAEWDTVPDQQACERAPALPANKKRK